MFTPMWNDIITNITLINDITEIKASFLQYFVLKQVPVSLIWKIKRHISITNNPIYFLTVRLEYNNNG